MAGGVVRRHGGRRRRLPEFELAVGMLLVCTDRRRANTIRLLHPLDMGKKWIVQNSGGQRYVITTKVILDRYAPPELVDKIMSRREDGGRGCLVCGRDAGASGCERIVVKRLVCRTVPTDLFEARRMRAKAQVLRRHEMWEVSAACEEELDESLGFA